MNFKFILKIFIVIVIILFLFFLFFSTQNKKTENQNNIIRINNKYINVDLALNKIQRAKGLSGRESLAENEGMLFVFNKEEEHLFWMKDMNFAIDIIWFSKNREIVKIQENVLPSTYPETFGENIESLYVLEVHPFFTKENNLKIGDKFDFVK